MISPTVVGLAALILAFALVSFRFFIRSSLSVIRGPASPSFLCGHLLELFKDPVGETEFRWQEQYGNVVRFKGILGENQLFLADPKALHKLLNVSKYTYAYPDNWRSIFRMIHGDGIFSTEGDVHKRHRSIMVPGFGHTETNESAQIFKECAESMSVHLLDVIQNEGGQASEIDVLPSILRAALDSIGQAAFDVKFAAMQDDSRHLANKYGQFLDDLLGLPSATQIFVQAASRFVPISILNWIADNGTHPRLLRARDLKCTVRNFAEKIVEEKANALLQGKGKRDVFSLLVKANMDADAKNRLSKEELFGQMSAILHAGHETMTNSYAWIVLELARNPSVQSKLREEIRRMEGIVNARGDQRLGTSDLGSMTYLNAVIKEGLRFHPPAPFCLRIATKDDVLPLSKPILTSSGEMIGEVHVPKGTQIFISIAAFNRNKDIWGEDAHRFNPDRWLNGTINHKEAAGLGVYSNLLTFLSGNRSCLGWRFTITELQVFLYEHVSKFEFGLTDKATRIAREPMFLMSPVVMGELGTRLPLTISIAPRDAGI